MKRHILIAVITLVVGIVTGFAADRLMSAQQEPVRSTTLFRTNLIDVPGKEADVFLLELAPGAATGKHSHPGYEIGYILEGSASIEGTGNTPITQKRGSVVSIEPNFGHDIKNPSQTEPMKAVVFALFDKGKSQTVPVK